MSGIIERIEAKVDQILAKLNAGVPPVDPPPIDPVDPPVEPPSGGPYVINGQGTLQPVYLPAIISVRNAMPGATLRWVKMPPVKLGLIKMTEGGEPVDGDGYGPNYNIGMGDHDYLLTPEVPGAVVAVQVR